MIFANAGLLWLWWWPTFDFERIRKGTLQPKVQELKTLMISSGNFGFFTLRSPLCLCVAWSRGVRARQGPVFNLLINWVLGGLTIPASHQPGGRRTAGLNAKLQTMEGSNVMKVYRRVGVDRSTAACRQFKYCNNNAKTSRSFIVTCGVALCEQCSAHSKQLAIFVNYFHNAVFLFSSSMNWLVGLLAAGAVTKCTDTKNKTFINLFTYFVSCPLSKQRDHCI